VREQIKLGRNQVYHVDDVGFRAAEDARKMQIVSDIGSK